VRNSAGFGWKQDYIMLSITCSEVNIGDCQFISIKIAGPLLTLPSAYLSLLDIYYWHVIFRMDEGHRLTTSPSYE